ncbi:MAG TPA: hypothetical protein P5185_01260, partial [Oscillospiraceae bacterium]|nr:hypothetical protein [Oscillospiraceae bacterium]
AERRFFIYARRTAFFYLYPPNGVFLSASAQRRFFMSYVIRKNALPEGERTKRNGDLSRFRETICRYGRSGSSYG